MVVAEKSCPEEKAQEMHIFKELDKGDDMIMKRKYTIIFQSLVY